MRLSLFVSASVLAGLSLAAPASYIQHEKRDVEHDNRWVKRDRAPGSARMPVRIAITQRNLDQGHDWLMEVADPTSPRYGQHWSSKEVADMFAPSQDSIDAISEWLSAAGIGSDRHAVSPGRHWIKFDAGLDEIEELLQTKYHVFENIETGEEHIACDEYHLPHNVHPHIDFVTPTVNMKAASLKKRSIAKRSGNSVAALPPINLGPATNTSGNDASKVLEAAASYRTCYKGVDTACVRAAYGIPAAPTSPQASNELGIFEEGDYYDQADLNSFWSTYYPQVPSGTGPVLKSVDGGKAPESEAVEAQQGNGEESLLDFELSIPLVYPQKVWLYQVDDAYEVAHAGGFGNTFLDALDASYCTFEGGDAPIDPKYPDPHGYNQPEQCGAYKPTNVISVSYGLAENTFTRAYETRQCAEFMKLGLQGVSVIYASGDSGVASRSGCLNGGGTFAPGYPATCPYVTSVGATMIVSGQNVTDQVAVSDPAASFYSGGGFSNYFAQPSYQASAVSAYFKNHKPPYAASVYNASGRGFPDLSAVGLNIINIDGGQKILQGGTSAAAPIFASIMNLINDARLKAGKNSTGFLNPTLYANPSAFTDITSGKNPGCGTNGFSAVTGWDPVTGLGTPLYPALEKAFLALP